MCLSVCFPFNRQYMPYLQLAALASSLICSNKQCKYKLSLIIEWESCNKLNIRNTIYMKIQLSFSILLVLYSLCWCLLTSWKRSWKRSIFLLNVSILFDNSSITPVFEATNLAWEPLGVFMCSEGNNGISVYPSNSGVYQNLQK